MRRDDGIGEVFQSSCVVESQATSGFLRLLNSLVQGGQGAYGAVGVRGWCSNPTNHCSVRALGNSGDGKERTGSCTAIGVASVQEGKEEGQAKGMGHTNSMVVEQESVRGFRKRNHYFLFIHLCPVTCKSINLYSMYIYEVSNTLGYTAI